MIDGLFKVLGKITEYIQTPEQRRRNNLIKLRKEYDRLIKEPSTPHNAFALASIAERIAKLQSDAVQK